MNKEKLLLHKNMMRNVLHKNYAMHDVEILRIEQRMHGLNFLVSSKNVNYYVKCSFRVNPEDAKTIAKVHEKFSDGEVYAPTMLSATNGEIPEYTLDDVTYTVVVTKYITGLSRYKDVSLTHLNINAVNVFNKFTEKLQAVKDEVIESNMVNYQYELVKSELPNYNANKATEFKLNKGEVDSLLKFVENKTKEKNEVMHGNLANNIFLDQKLKTVILDFDHMSLGSKTFDLARLVAGLQHQDIITISKQVKKSDEYNFEDFMKLLEFSLVYEVLETHQKYEYYAGFAGEPAVRRWLHKKVARLRTFKEFNNERLI